MPEFTRSESITLPPEGCVPLDGFPPRDFYDYPGRTCFPPEEHPYWPLGVTRPPLPPRNIVHDSPAYWKWRNSIDDLRPGSTRAVDRQKREEREAQYRALVDADKAQRRAWEKRQEEYRAKYGEPAGPRD